MSSPAISAHPEAGSGVNPIWSKLPLLLAVGGLVAALTGLALTNGREFGHSYLTAFMFFLSLCLGSLFLVLVHHLFDAGWSVPVRRFLEHLAFLAPVLWVLFIPIMVMARPYIYDWLSLDPHTDHALHAKQPLFTPLAFYAVSNLLFAIWTLWSWRLRSLSLEQDKTGSAQCTISLRRWAAGGIYVFAFSLTLGAIYWMKSLQHQWFSTMYGVYYFAGSVWVTLATTYVIALVAKRTGRIPMLHRRQFHDLGVLFFTFTVFYAYIHFSQYFLIWNAAVPEETFWYVLREKGTWWYVGLLIIFGHFVLPFVALLRIDAKLSPTVVVPLAIWAWLMHYCDMQFNIMPLVHPNGIKIGLADLGSFAFMGGVLALVFLKYFNAHPAYPVKDPRLSESLERH